MIHTNLGNITLKLDAEKAPKTVNNFLSYVREGHYEGLLFHRVIKDFMIQGGGFDKDFNRRPVHEPIVNEARADLPNSLYTVAMARTADPHTATSQFFINTNNNDFLNHKSKTVNGYGYAVFGKVVDGFDVVDTIQCVETGLKGFHQDVPKVPVEIFSIR